jgi:hypothetical protein
MVIFSDPAPKAPLSELLVSPQLSGWVSNSLWTSVPQVTVGALAQGWFTGGMMLSTQEPPLANALVWLSVAK